MEDIKDAFFNMIESVINMNTSIYKDDKKVAKFVTFAIEHNVLNTENIIDENTVKSFIKHVNKNLSNVTDFDTFVTFSMKTYDFNILNMKNFHLPLHELIQLFQTKKEDELLESLHKNFLMFYFISINTLYEDIENCEKVTKTNYDTLLAFFEGDTFSSDSLSDNVIDFLKLLNDEINESKTTEVYQRFDDILSNSQLNVILTNLIHGVLLCAKVKNCDTYIQELNNEICQYEKSTIKKYIELAKNKLKSEEVKQVLDIVANFSDLDISKMSNLLGIVSDLDMNNLDINNIGGMLKMLS